MGLPELGFRVVGWGVEEKKAGPGAAKPRHSREAAKVRMEVCALVGYEFLVSRGL